MRNLDLRGVLTGVMLIAWVLVGVSEVFADRLELLNGDVITGVIERIDEHQVVIRTDYGVLEIDRAAVRLGQFGADDSQVGDSLVMYFRFSGDLAEETGVYRATNNGMRFVADRDGLPASALRSDGSGTFLSISPTRELNTLNQFTIFFWVRLEDLSSTEYLLSKWTGSDGETADGKVAVQVAGANVTVYIVDADGVYHWVTARDVLSAQEWHALTVSFAAGRVSVYMDGEVVASQRFDFTSLYEDSAPVLLMTAVAQANEAYAYYNALGAIDELRIYSRALSPEEVALLSGASPTE